MKQEFIKIALTVNYCVGVLNLAMFWVAVMCDKGPDWAALAVIATQFIAPFISSCVAQVKLKKSLNEKGLRLGADGLVTTIK